MSLSLPESCEQLLAEMVRFNTVNSHISGEPNPERKLAEYIEALAHECMGLGTQRLDNHDGGFNLLVTHQVHPDAPWLLFESHLDTVTVEDMTIEPFEAAIENGRIYGRGACDTKGTGAAMLWALHQYATHNTGPNNIAIVYTTDEEIGKTGITRFVDQQLPTLACQPVGVIVGEPTELHPIVAHNGVARWAIRTQGIAAHSADPSKGRSAISMMMPVIEMIEQQYIPSLDASHPLTGQAQASVNVIRGGTQINIIPEYCEIQLDRRVVPGEDIHDILPTVERLLDTLRREHAGMRVTQGAPFLDPPLDPAGGEAFATLIASTLQSLGLPAEPRGAAYCTDASQFSKLGVPTVVLGPGDIAQAHTKDEWLALDQLRQGVMVYEALMHSPWSTMGSTQS